MQFARIGLNMQKTLMIHSFSEIQVGEYVQLGTLFSLLEASKR